MATYDFKKLGDVEALESVPENANALVEVGGDIKRVPGSNLGGGGVPTAILVMDTDEASGVSVASLKEGRVGDSIRTATCSNMTFAEVKELMLAGKPVDMIMSASVSSVDGGYLLFSPAITTGYFFAESQPKTNAGAMLSEIVGATFGIAMINDVSSYLTLYWFEDGTITSDFNYTPAT